MRSMLLLAPLLFACGAVVDPARPGGDPRLAAAAALPVAAGPHGSQAGQPIDDGGNVLLTDEVADRLAQAGGWVRVNFRLGPYPADTPALYAAYDEIVDRLRGRGLQVLGLLSNESWPGSQADWTAGSWEHEGGDGNNAYIDAFGEAFLRIATHFQGRVRSWEIWNEPNCWADNPAPGVFTGCSYIYPSNFAALLARTYGLARERGLDVEIVSGGLFGHDIGGLAPGPAGAEYLEATYAAGVRHTGTFERARAAHGAYPLDAIGQHLYIQQGEAVDSAWLDAYLSYYRDVIERWEGDGRKRTWLTEFGWTTAAVSEDTQADNLEAALRLFRERPFVQAALHFQIDDIPVAGHAYGLFRPGGSPKPAAARYGAVASYQGRRADGSRASAIVSYFEAHGGMAEHGSPYDNGGGPFVHGWDYGEVQDFAGGAVGRCAIFVTGGAADPVGGGVLGGPLRGGGHHPPRVPPPGPAAPRGGTRPGCPWGGPTLRPGAGAAGG